MQPPDAIAVANVCGIDRVSRVVCAVVRYLKADRLPSAGRRHAHRLTLPVNLVGMQIVARRAGGSVRHPDLAPSLLQGEGALERFGSLDPRLDQQIRNERRVVRLRWLVGRVMQLDPVGDLLFPSHPADGVKGRREQAAGFYQQLGLCRGGGEVHAKRSSHSTYMLQLTRCSCKKLAARRFPCRLKADSPRAVALAYER
jgi:hypothetical protein